VKDLSERIRERLESDDEIDSLLEELRQEASPLPHLEKLAASRSGPIREWTASAAATTMGADATALLLALARDRDPDVRDTAIQELVEVNPDAARTLGPVFRKKLKSRDYYDPVSAMWTLAKLDDSSSLDDIRRIRDEATIMYHQKTAEVVVLMLEKEYDTIFATLEQHLDHDGTRMFATAARRIGSDEALHALEICSSSAPDEECRQVCRGALEEFREQRGGEP
jgi:hypothetical protein